MKNLTIQRGLVCMSQAEFDRLQKHLSVIDALKAENDSYRDELEAAKNLLSRWLIPVPDAHKQAVPRFSTVVTDTVAFLTDGPLLND